MQSYTLPKSEYVKLGRRLQQADPVYAERLLSTSHVLPLETDFTKVNEYYRSFCIYLELDPEKYNCATRDRSTKVVRLLFIACILHIYQPATYTLKHSELLIKYGVVKALSEVIKVKKSRISKDIREALVLTKTNDDDFSQKVKAIMEGLK